MAASKPPVKTVDRRRSGNFRKSLVNAINTHTDPQVNNTRSRRSRRVICPSLRSMIPVQDMTFAVDISLFRSLLQFVTIEEYLD